jgi:hypothetical protein
VRIRRVVAASPEAQKAAGIDEGGPSVDGCRDGEGFRVSSREAPRGSMPVVDAIVAALPHTVLTALADVGMSVAKRQGRPDVG